MQLLLVSRTPRWQEAVCAVAAGIDGSRVVPCEAREALVQIAGSQSFSHLLLEEGCADGLLDALSDLTSSHAQTNTSLLLLGNPDRSLPERPVANRPVSNRRLPDRPVIRTASPGTIRKALALKAARSGGPPPGSDSAIPTAELHDALKGAVSGAMIEARYQPIMRLADRQPVAFEALARLKHPVRGTLLPGRFVPQLEEAGLGRALTELVCARVFADLTRHLLPENNLAIALNFPLDVLLEPAALDVLEEQRRESGIPARQVIIELTESRPVQTVHELARSLDRLRALGYGVAIDDVGPAVPMVRSLLDLPFTCLKLDKGIVQRSLHDPEALSFLTTTANAAKARGMKVVAEGVETEQLWEWMASHGIDEAQGFLVARPLPVSALPIWLEAWPADRSRPA